MKFAILTISLLTVVAGAWSVVRYGSAADLQPQSPNETKMSPDEAKTVYGVGYVEPVTEIRRISFDATGTIGRVKVCVGQRVSSQHLLVELASAEEAQAVQVAQGELAVEKANHALILRGVNDHRIAAARHNVDACRQRLTFCELEFERTQSLRKSATVTQSEFDKTSMQLNESRAQLAHAEAELAHLDHYVLPEDKSLAAEKVRLAESKLKLLVERLDKTRLLAPCDGTVLEILKLAGEHVAKESQDPVIIFGDVSQLRVRGEVDERNAHTLRVGQQVKVYGRNLGGTVYPARVSSIKAIMGQKTVFARTAQERKNLDVLQAFVDFDGPVDIPVGLRVDIAIDGGVPNADLK